MFKIKTFQRRILFALLAVALMSVFMMVRHTRTEEETERAEMIRALPVGRHAHLGAAFAGTALAHVLVGAGIFVSLVVYDLPASGALAFGLATLGTGLVFAGVAAVTAQIAGGSRAALALGGATIAVAFVLHVPGPVEWLETASGPLPPADEAFRQRFGGLDD